MYYADTAPAPPQCDVHRMIICLLCYFPLGCSSQSVSLSLCLSLQQEMIIDKVNGQPIPRYLIYDIIKITVSMSQVDTRLPLPGGTPKLCLLRLEARSVY